MGDITCFEGSYKFLSNFWPSEVIYLGHVYPTVEHAYQAAKSIDKEVQATIRAAKSPGLARQLGRQLVVRPDWDKVKLHTMEYLLRRKFKNPELLALLHATGNAKIVEGNTWRDTYWGVYQGKGSNYLGKLLMKIRDEK